MMRPSAYRALLVVSSLAFLPLAYTQPSDRFEVAVINPTPPGASGTSMHLYLGGRVNISNEPVKLLIRIAFGLQDSQIAAGPAWLDSARFDIEAKTGRPEKIAPAELGPLMRSLLEERFGLQSHREKREQNVLALVTAGSPKLNPAAEGETSGMNTDNRDNGSHLSATATSMSLLAGYVGNRLGRLVLDQTGLTGAYDFTLDWAPDESPDSSTPSLATAIREQLGLKLDSRKAPVEVLVIDRLNKPTEN